MKIRCIVIDDEPFALKQMEGYVNKTPFLELVGSCANAFEAMELLNEKDIDAAFVDINMPEMTGMEFVKTHPDLAIIFTTAYSEYAVESYKVSAIDYLLKPIGYEDFLRAAKKLEERKPETLTEEANDHFFIKVDSKTVRVNFEEILFIESQSEYVKIILDNKSLLTLMSLKKLETILPTSNFMRVHRSYIVNLQKINTIERFRILFDGYSPIPVSDQYKDQFKTFVNNRFFS
ncbi:MAG: DNA-binding response regulator [Salinivirgaceae bacterium]|nr:MAG: DNA-binding response regulator [Salinivirgaceae bacterium]